MRPVAQGRPGTEVIPTGWSDAHRPVVDQTHVSVCSIRHPGGTAGTFDPDTLQYVGGTANAAHFAGPCRVEDLPADEQFRVVADEQIPLVGYVVILAYDAAPAAKVDDIVTITTVDDNGDPTLVGKQLVVDSIKRSSLAWERVLICTENQS
jgi:hypothetical protein